MDWNILNSALFSDLVSAQTNIEAKMQRQHIYLSQAKGENKTLALYSLLLPLTNVEACSPKTYFFLIHKVHLVLRENNLT